MVRVVRISDGLGNQMFQYAFARKVQLRCGGSVYLDTRFINNEDKIARGEKSRYLEENDSREYGLNHFKITLPIADERILSRWSYINPQSTLERKIFELSQRGIGLSHFKDEAKVQEKKRGSIGSYGLPVPTYFQGYYFSLKYYDDIKFILQKEFHLKKQMRLPEWLRHVLQSENTVSIHVRRGDFTRLSQDISKRTYYRRAVKLIKRRIPSPVFLIFSDEIEWVKENFSIDGEKIYISDMGFADYEELTIMKHCKHHIVANSTFSYWAAYLNPNVDKIVFYPETWEKRDIIPRNWIGIL